MFLGIVEWGLFVSVVTLEFWKGIYTVSYNFKRGVIKYCKIEEKNQTLQFYVEVLICKITWSL